MRRKSFGMRVFDGLPRCCNAIIRRFVLKRAHRLAVRTPPFHGGNRGSIPLGRTNLLIHLELPVIKSPAPLRKLPGGERRQKYRSAPCGAGRSSGTGGRRSHCRPVVGRLAGRADRPPYFYRLVKARSFPVIVLLSSGRQIGRFSWIDDCSLPGCLAWRARLHLQAWFAPAALWPAFQAAVEFSMNWTNRRQMSSRKTMLKPSRSVIAVGTAAGAGGADGGPGGGSAAVTGAMVAGAGAAVAGACGFGIGYIE